jgi:hypothetical protein
MLAVDVGTSEIVDVLLPKSDVNNKVNGYSPLYIAAGNQDLPMVTKLIGAGADVNSENGPAGRTPLIVAAHVGNLQIVDKLLEKGADKNKRDSSGEVPISFASDSPRNRQELMQRLRSGEAGTHGTPLGRTQGTSWGFIHTEGVSPEYALVDNFVLKRNGDALTANMKLMGSNPAAPKIETMRQRTGERAQAEQQPLKNASGEPQLPGTDITGTPGNMEIPLYHFATDMNEFLDNPQVVLSNPASILPPGSPLLTTRDVVSSGGIRFGVGSPIAGITFPTAGWSEFNNFWVGPVGEKDHRVAIHGYLVEPLRVNIQGRGDVTLQKGFEMVSILMGRLGRSEGTDVPALVPDVVGPTTHTTPNFSQKERDDYKFMRSSRETKRAEFSKIVSPPLAVSPANLAPPVAPAPEAAPEAAPAPMPVQQVQLSSSIYDLSEPQLIGKLKSYGGTLVESLERLNGVKGQGDSSAQQRIFDDALSTWNTQSELIFTEAKARQKKANNALKDAEDSLSGWKKDAKDSAKKIESLKTDLEKKQRIAEKSRTYTPSGVLKGVKKSLNETRRNNYAQKAADAEQKLAEAKQAQFAKDELVRKGTEAVSTAIDKKRAIDAWYPQVEKLEGLTKAVKSGDMKQIKPFMDILRTETLVGAPALPTLGYDVHKPISIEFPAKPVTDLSRTSGLVAPLERAEIDRLVPPPAAPDVAELDQYASPLPLDLRESTVAIPRQEQADVAELDQYAPALPLIVPSQAPPDVADLNQFVPPPSPPTATETSPPTATETSPVEAEAEAEAAGPPARRSIGNRMKNFFGDIGRRRLEKRSLIYNDTIPLVPEPTQSIAPEQLASLSAYRPPTRGKGRRSRRKGGRSRSKKTRFRGRKV